MTTFESELLKFGFVDITRQWYEPWKIQRAYRYGYKYYIIFDEPNEILFKDAREIDHTSGITESQARAFFAFLKLSHSDRKIVKSKLFHLDDFINNFQSRIDTRIAFKRLIFNYQNMKLEWKVQE